jgi:hypothetical protein
VALSGGSNRATALSLNFYPYLAIILTQGIHKFPQLLNALATRVLFERLKLQLQIIELISCLLDSRGLM